MVIVFEQQLTSEAVEELINKIEKVEDYALQLYITSEGGYTYCSRILTDYLISKKNSIDISVIASGYIDSCAFELLIDLNSSGRIRVAVLEGTTALVHKYSVRVDSNDLTKSFSTHAKKIASVDRVNNNLVKKLRLTHEQAKLFFAGEDQLLDTPEIIRILNGD